MYESLYGLREPAFTLTPNPEFLFLNERSSEALNQILYGIQRREGFAVIVGDVGTGKTTLSWALLEKLEEKKVHTALIQNPMLSETDLLRAILQDLGVKPKSGSPDAISEAKAPSDLFDSSWMSKLSKKELIDRLDAFLVERAQEGIFTVLIIDEAQNLSMETLEQLRLLSNLETAKEKLLQIIFVGQLELVQKLDSPALRQLNQRISFRFETRALTWKNTEEYIRHRLRVAGANPRLGFERGAFDAIHRYSKGYPRLINLICDRALLCAFNERSFVVTAKMVRDGFHAIREPHRDSIAIRVKRILLVGGLLIPALLIASIGIWRRVSFHDIPVSQAASPPYVPAAGPSAATHTTPEIPPAIAVTAAKRGKTEMVKPQLRIASGSGDSSGKMEYFLQVYSFRPQKDAAAASEALMEEGYPSYIKYSLTPTNGGWYGVYVGPFEDLGAAKKIASKLESSRTLSSILRSRAAQ